MQEIRRLRADKFERVKLAEGNWRVSYYDATHLPENIFIELGEIHFLDVESPELFQGKERIFVPFAFEIVSQEFLSKNFEEAWSGGKEVVREKKKYAKRVYDELSQTFLRCLMKSPKIAREDLEHLKNRTISQILISDTNAVKNGLLNWLCHSFSQAHNWIAFLIISQIQFQEATEEGKKKSSDPKFKRYEKVLRRRSLANLGTYMEKKLKEKLPVEFIDLPPELLRYYGGRRDAEGERVTTILEDRLLIEGIKLFFKERNISVNVKRTVVTSDLYLTKFLDLESIPYLYGEVENLADGESLYSTKYNLFRRDFDFCKIHTLLWDLTYVFSTIKVDNPDTGEYFILRYYPVDTSRSPMDWKEEALFVEHFEAKKPLVKEISRFRDSKRVSAKDVSLNAILDVLEFIRSRKRVKADELMKALSKSQDYLNDALYVLLGIGLVEQEGEVLLETGLSKEFFSTWDKGDLFSLHEIFLNLVSYERFIQLLSEKSPLPTLITKSVPKEIFQMVRDRIGSIKGYVAIKNWGISLGTVYLAEGMIYYGSNRPTIEEFAQAIENEFSERKAIGKQVAVSQLVDSVCKKLRITPVRFEKYINESLKQGFLKNLEPHAAAGIGKKGVHKVLQSRGAPQRFRTIAIDASIIIAGTPVKALVLRKNKL